MLDVERFSLPSANKGGNERANEPIKFQLSVSSGADEFFGPLIAAFASRHHSDAAPPDPTADDP